MVHFEKNQRGINNTQLGIIDLGLEFMCEIAITEQIWSKNVSVSY